MLTHTGQQGRQQFVARSVLQPRKSRRKGVQALGQHRVITQAGRPLGREGLREQALIGRLQMLGLQRHRLQQKGQAQALRVGHVSSPCRRSGTHDE